MRESNSRPPAPKAGIIPLDQSPETYHNLVAKDTHKSWPRKKKSFGGTGIRARVKRITTAYANHYTIPPDYGPNREHAGLDSN